MKYFIILKDSKVKGIFGSLKRACDSMKGKDFPSYWTLTRKKLKPFDIYGSYSMQIVKTEKRV